MILFRGKYSFLIRVCLLFMYNYVVLRTMYKINDQSGWVSFVAFVNFVQACLIIMVGLTNRVVVDASSIRIYGASSGKCEEIWTMMLLFYLFIVGLFLYWIPILNLEDSIIVISLNIIPFICSVWALCRRGRPMVNLPKIEAAVKIDENNGIFEKYAILVNNKEYKADRAFNIHKMPR